MPRAGSLPSEPRSPHRRVARETWAEGALSGRLPFLSVTDRRCQATNRAGDPCRAAPLRDSQWCGAHDPQRPAATRFGSREQAAEAATGVQRRTPSLTEKLRERVEQESDRIIDPYFEALDAGENAELRMRAAERLLDRVYGRPRAAELEQATRFAEQTAAQIGEVMTDFARRLGHSLDAPEVRAAAGAALRLAADRDAEPAAANGSGRPRG